MSSSIMNKFFTYLIVYYWLIIYIQTLNSGVSGSLIYILVTLPVTIFVFYGLLNIKDLSIPIETNWILMFLFVSVYLSFIRSDYSTLISALLFSLLIFNVLYFNLTPSLRLVNTIFLISVILSVPLYYSGYSIYGFIPGQANIVTNNEFLFGRVSLFPNVTTSIYFSFIVFILNYFFNKNLYQKIIFLILSLYFIYFGISRTVLMLLLFILFLSYLFTKAPLEKNWLYQIIFPILFIGLPLLIVIFIDDIVGYLLSLHNEFISTYFFRGYTTVDDVINDIARTNIWTEHIRLFKEYPWGLSPEQINMFANSSVHLSDGGSESFMTRILVRYGFGAFFFYIFLVSILNRAIHERNSYMYIFFYIIVFLGLTYGAFFTAYNMLFLVFISSINIKEKKI